MSELFFAADHHFDHAAVIKFTDENGKKYRDFPDLDTMHQHIIAQHNSVVGVNDTVYFLGDVSFSGPGLEYLNEMNGTTKHLIMGNHDKFDSQLYLKYFKSIHGGFKKHNVFMSHIPIHPSQLNNSRGWALSLHGHLHADRVKTESGLIDTRYYNVSMECIDFTPVHFDTIKQFIRDNQ
jgi:calcineurin-like phosphoesterase family protein